MMTIELPKSYAPDTSESEIRRKWEDAGAFHTTPDAPGEPYCIVIPPPNVTAPLHLGHAFNNTLQDILSRYHRMRGYNVLWMPGTDHAGIATQTVVEKRLLQQGTKRVDLGREAFVKKVQAWKDEYEATIIEQLQAMGCSCDWDRVRFTMDPVCGKAVREAFFRLFKDGLIYRGKRLVNWDPVTLTALADDEVEMKDVQGHMWYLRYPLVEKTIDESSKSVLLPVSWNHLFNRGYPNTDIQINSLEEQAWVTVATTRPETYLGDTAVAINANDPRSTALKGLFVQLPLVDRIIPIIEDRFVALPAHPLSRLLQSPVMTWDGPGAPPGGADAKSFYSSGFLKVTPAHDQNDYEIGLRHNLPIINVMAPDASISNKFGWVHVGQAGKFLNLSREAARKEIVDTFSSLGLLAGEKPYRHSVGHSYRSHVPIEPYFSDQWYVKVTDDSWCGEAQRAMVDEQFEGTAPTRATSPSIEARPGDKALTFYPARYAKTFQSWHENLRDWCISRQLWWGHRIPVWTLEAEAELLSDPPRFVGEEFSDFDEFDSQIEQWETEDRLYSHDSRFGPDDTVQYRRLTVCVRDENDTNLIQALEENGFEQDPDVLDTWFSSGLWPISTMGWPDPAAFPETEGLLDTFNPSTVLVTGRDIITLWVSRMVMFNRYLRGGTLPFRHVYINPMIQDGHGQRMSKSLGNGVDPRDIIHSHGADALRFTLCQIATSTQDVRLPVDMICPACEHEFDPKMITSPAGYRVAAPEQACPKCSKELFSAYGVATGLAVPTDEKPLAMNSSSKFDLGRNFANKLWNAVRFALGNLTGDEVETPPMNEWKDTLSLADRWIITRLHRTLHTVEDAVADYQFSVYAETMYDFIWRDFCDWYLEAIKPTVRENPIQQQVLRTVLNAILRLLHPICPFVTEALWPHVQAAGSAGMDGISLPPNDVLARADWPEIDATVEDDKSLELFERARKLSEVIRTIRGEKQISPKKKIDLHASKPLITLINAADGLVQTASGLGSVTESTDRPKDALTLSFEGEQLFLAGLSEAIDVAEEHIRQKKIVEELQKAVAGYRNKLQNDNYVKRAPPNVVQETRDRLVQSERDLDAAEKVLETLTT